MYEKLSGHGARRDSARCRTQMHSIMSKFHPSIWNSYVAGRVKDLPGYNNDEMGTTKRPTRPDVRPDVVDFGGSLHPLTHSENGFLVSHNPEFHETFEVV